jgi:hypothetical protein
MRGILQRSLGVASIVLGVVVIFASTTIVDVPGPMEPTKPEFVFKFNSPVFALALALAVIGIVLFARSWKGIDEPCEC